MILKGASQRMQLKELIRQFGARVGYPSIPFPDSTGGITLRFDDLEVICREEGNGGLLIGTIEHGKLEGTALEELFRKLLGISLARAAKSTCILSLDRARDTLILYTRFDCSTLGPAEFEAYMDTFLNELEFWSEQIRRDPGFSEKITPFTGVRP
jgi:hypothetical protein